MNRIPIIRKNGLIGPRTDNQVVSSQDNNAMNAVPKEITKAPVNDSPALNSKISKNDTGNAEGVKPVVSKPVERPLVAKRLFEDELETKTSESKDSAVRTEPVKQDKPVINTAVKKDIPSPSVSPIVTPMKPVPTAGKVFQLEDIIENKEKDDDDDDNTEINVQENIQVEEQNQGIGQNNGNERRPVIIRPFADFMDGILGEDGMRTLAEQIDITNRETMLLGYVNARCNVLFNKLEETFHLKNTDRSVYKWFYSFMNYLGKCYINIPGKYNTLVDTVDDSVHMKEEDRFAFYKSVTRSLSMLSGPFPSNRSSSYKSENVKLLNVIPVGCTNFRMNTKLFFCVFYPNIDLGELSKTMFAMKEDGYNFKNFFISYHRNIESDNRIFTVHKSTDRVTMRIQLAEVFTDRDMLDFALFIMENIHIIGVNKDYFVENSRLVVFDLYSFVINIFHHYDADDSSDLNRRTNRSLRNNILRKQTMGKPENPLLGKRNRFIKEIGIKTPHGMVSDDTTIAYAFWLYRLKYIYPEHKDFSWIGGLDIRTNRDSSVKNLCYYSIRDKNDSENILTIDSDMGIMSGVNNYQNYFRRDDYNENELKKLFDHDLEKYYNKQNVAAQVCILVYLRWFYDHFNRTVKLNHLDISYIYQIIYTAQTSVDFYDMLLNPVNDFPDDMSINERFFEILVRASPTSKSDFIRKFGISYTVHNPDDDNDDDYDDDSNEPSIDQSGFVTSKVVVNNKPVRESDRMIVRPKETERKTKRIRKPGKAKNNIKREPDKKKEIKKDTKRLVTYHYEIVEDKITEPENDLSEISSTESSLTESQDPIN